ncbi:MAG: protein-L-isoaspartate(D-aspartate) O-methyltransferase [Chloroflexi bacterium]|nr:protein-L-isoaspartate(D-aspartate) O-methyltransferase [Chloroflexota bacterium]
MNNTKHYSAQRESMVTDQIAWRGIRTPGVLDAMRTVPRHLFVPADQRAYAYSDGALRIDHGQTISQPYIVALMTDLLELRGGEKVLEVGTGSGYQAAVLSRLAAEVYTIERHAPLAEKAAQILKELHYDNIHIHTGDGSVGLPEYAPYQAIMVTAAAPKVPQPLLDQLDEGGRLVLPVGSRYSQILEYWQRHGEQFKQKTITAVAFVPLLGEKGWEEKISRNLY